MDDNAIVTKVKPGECLSFLGDFHYLELQAPSGQASFIHQCCDCGLQHKTTIVKTKGAIRIKMVRI